MRLGAIAFLAGILTLHTLAELPNLRWGWCLPVVVGIIVYVPPLRLLAWITAGFLWALVWIGYLHASQLPAELESIDLRAEGWIAAIPRTFYRSTRFELQVDALHRGDIRIPFTGKLRLSWYDNPPSLRVGDKWRLTVRLKHARGLANPGSFDHERWLWINHIAAQGYVRDYPEPQQLAAAVRYPVDRFRQALVERYSQLLPGNPYVGILTALAVGESQGIQPHQWEVFNTTGTGHLLSISGLHIGLIAGLVFILVRKAWGWLPLLSRRFPAKQAAALAALLGAGGYSLLAGLALPTQRALVMIAVALLALLWRRPVVPSRILALALLVVLIIDPLAPLTGSFWLSFGAVAAILYTVVGRSAGLWRDWLGLQLAVTLALLPALLILFQQIPVLSPLANLVAVPWTNMTVVPLALLAVLAGLVSEAAQLALLKVAALAMDWLWRFLEWLTHSPWLVSYHPAPPGWTLLLALPGLLLLLAPAGTPRRWLGVVLCMPLLFVPKSAPAPGAIWFTLLDVGQGLAAVIRTAEHLLIYDTGPRAGFDAGRTVLVPFLRQQGLKKLDTLIVSHADNEHMGGTRSLLEHFAVTTVLTPFPLEVPIEGAQPCRAGIEWNWDRVRFRLLYPSEGTGFSGNNASCVLLVESARGRLLLTGDIESPAQAALVKAYGVSLAADVLVAPGQGAGKPPLQDFLTAVQPRYVLFSTAYKNRFGFPKSEIVQSYRESGAAVLDTVHCGAIMFRLETDTIEYECYRQQIRRYWRVD